MMMRYLIHVTGDIHQPLHASTLITDKFPNGDEGGNLFYVKYIEGINNLHKLYDSGVGKLNNNITRPLVGNDENYITTTAKEIMAEFNQSNLLELHKKRNFTQWAMESRQISQDFIYPNIEYDATPSDDYINKAWLMVKRRIALGGYRLAEMLKEIKQAYDEKNKEELMSFLSG